MADWVTISALATAGGTLVLAGATFSSVKSANRAARVAERSLLAGLVFLVAAGASHVTTLGVGLLVCLGLELLGEAGVRPDLGSDATDVVEGPMSPAA